ncbi:PucR family transcriptional regulator, partial [Amycolatopsis sp. SID8362]|nr:PucR family transcriptional regulator [Amycolatopsis sp. SID8362]NED47994.1 PucR family transcriptional regulator [Amycolatopsis sp. SID8362]
MTTPQPLPPGAVAPLARAVVAGIRHAVPEHAPLFDAGAAEFVAALLNGS